MARLNQSSSFLLKSAIDSGITSPAELAALMGNADIETKGFTTMREKFNYSSVEKVLNASASASRRFTRDQIQAAVDSRDPEQIATILYENRDHKDLGNSQPGDGWRFHGRGYFQFTGRYNYTTYGKKFGIDLVSDPELAIDREISAKLALAFWQDVPRSRKEDPVAAGRWINGGKHSAEHRLASARSWAMIITPELIRDVRSGALTFDQLAAMDPGHEAPLRHGRREDVRLLQTNLNRLGYTDAEGRRLTNDGDYGRRTRLAVEAFQRDHGLVADGLAGPLTMAAVHLAVETECRSIGQSDAPYLRTQEQIDALSAYRSLSPEPVAPAPLMPVVRFDAPEHPDHALYLDARAHVHDLDRQYGKVPDLYSDNLSAALVVAARSSGLCQIDRIELSRNASCLSAVESPIGQPERRAEVPIVASLNLPLEQSSTQWPATTHAYELSEVRAQGYTLESAQSSVRTPAPAMVQSSGIGLNDPRHPESPQHTLYKELERCVPQASEDRLLQFTVACHKSRITEDNLSEVRLDEERSTIEFIGTGVLTRPAKIDLDSAPPFPEQAIEQIQQHDQLQAQIMEEVRVQQAQMSMGRSL